MWRFLLDTNIASFLAKGTNTSVSERARLTPSAYLAISSVTEAEMRFGMERLPADARLRQTVPRFLSGIESAPWDSLCAQHFGCLQTHSEAPVARSAFQTP